MSRNLLFKYDLVHSISLHAGLKRRRLNKQIKQKEFNKIHKIILI